MNTSVKMHTFTPIFDTVVQDVGLVGASVYGRVWRYCQMKRHCCDAALETIAQTLNISTRTVLRWAKELCKQGYLKDLTPDLKNKPHTYAVTSKLRLAVEIKAEVDDKTETTDRETESRGATTESHTESDRESLEETSKTPNKKEQESATPTAPTSFEGWLKAGQESTNKIAVLKWMYDTLFPSQESPDYGYMGIVVKRVGGPGRLAQLLWEAAAKRPAGDVLAYIQATVKGKKANGGPSTPRTPQPTTVTFEMPEWVMS